MGKQNQALFVHGLLGDEVGNFKQGHGPSPEDNQTSVSDMSAQQLTGKVDQASVSGPPGKPGRF
jgi:hypothetical protein